MDEKQLQNLLNGLLPSKQSPLSRFLLLLLGLVLCWLTLAGLVLGLCALALPAASMTYANALGWVGFFLLALGTVLLLKETK